MEEKNVTYRTRVHYIMPSQELINEARLSNNIYNQALYILRQAFANEEKLSSKFDLVKTLRHKKYECEEYNNFSKMVSCNAEAIIHLAAQNFKAFLMALKAFKKNKSSFTGAPRIPSYNKKEQEFMVIIRDTQCTIKNGMMRFPGKLNLDKIYVGDIDIAHVKIFPGKKKYKVEVVYKVEALPKKTKGNIAGIDLGLDNLATVAINKRGIRPLLINGRPLKSMNLYFNNKRDKVQSELKKCNDKYMSHKLETLYRKRNNRFNTYMHKASKKIIEQKDNEMIKIPTIIMFNMFMDYIQDTCGQPYDLFEDALCNERSVDIYDEEFSNILVDEKWNCRYYLSLIQYLLKKYNGSAKKFIMSGNFYAVKTDTEKIDVILSDDFTTIEEFDFAKED